MGWWSIMPTWWNRHKNPQRTGFWETFTLVNTWCWGRAHPEGREAPTYLALHIPSIWMFICLAFIISFYNPLVNRELLFFQVLWAAVGNELILSGEGVVAHRSEAHETTWTCDYHLKWGCTVLWDWALHLGADSISRQSIRTELGCKTQSLCHRELFGAGKTATHLVSEVSRDFPIGTMDKNLPSSAGNTGSIPGSGRFHIPGPVGVGVGAATKICAQLLKPVSLEPVLHKNRSHCNEKPKLLKEE